MGDFNLLSPSNGAVGVSVNPTLTWDDETYMSILSCTVYCKTSPPVEPPYDIPVDPPDFGSVTLSGLQSNTLYYWGVNIEWEDQFGVHFDLSDTWSFTTESSGSSSSSSSSSDSSSSSSSLSSSLSSSSSSSSSDSSSSSSFSSCSSSFSSSSSSWSSPSWSSSSSSRSRSSSSSSSRSRSSGSYAPPADLRDSGVGPNLLPDTAHGNANLLNKGRGGSWPHYKHPNVMGQQDNLQVTERTGLGTGEGFTGPAKAYPGG